MVTPLSLVVKANGLMQASSYTYEAVDQAGSLLLSRARLVPQFQMANLTPAARQQAAFKRQLNSATRRRQFEDFSGWDLHDKSLGLPRWIQPQEPNKILSHADALTVYSVEEEQYEPLSTAVNETSPLAIHGLGISTYREVFGPCYKAVTTILKKYKDTIFEASRITSATTRVLSARVAQY